MQSPGLVYELLNIHRDRNSTREAAGVGARFGSSS
jgi:hypothetical protein